MSNQTPTYNLKGYAKVRTPTDHAASTVLTVATFEGIHRSTNATSDVKLTLPVITTAMIGKSSTLEKWGVGDCHFQAGTGNTIADGADSTIVCRNSIAGQAKVASVTLTAVSSTEWAWENIFGSWTTEPV